MPFDTNETWATSDAGVECSGIGPPGMTIATVSNGNSLNHPLGSAVNILSDVHGVTGEQCLELMQKAKEMIDSGKDSESSAEEVIAGHSKTEGK